MAGCGSIDLEQRSLSSLASYGATQGSHERLLHLQLQRQEQEQEQEHQSRRKRHRRRATCGGIAIPLCVGLIAGGGVVLLAREGRTAFLDLTSGVAELPVAGGLGSGSSSISVEEGTCSVLFFADLHVEPFFSQTETDALGQCRAAECLPGTLEFPGDACRPQLDEHSRAIPRIGCDPPITLLHSALSYASKMNQGIPPCAVIVGGDMVAHGLWGDAKTLDLIQRKVRAAFLDFFPSSPVIFAIGNNDLAGHGVVTPSELERLWSISSGEGDEGELETSDDHVSSGRASGVSMSELLGKDGKNRFMLGGYYRTDLSSVCNSNLSILVLNTQLLVDADEYLAVENPLQAGQGQLDWLETELQNIRNLGGRAMIIGHIPPGIHFGKPDWKLEFQNRFIAMCDNFGDTIAMQLYGHHSKELMRGLSPRTGLLVSIGLTPMGGHSNRRKGEVKWRESVNPGFGEVMYDIHTGKASNYRAHYMNLQVLSDRMHLLMNNATAGETGGGFVEMADVWGMLYDFKELYGMPDVSSASIWEASRKIMKDNVIGAIYKSMARGFMSSLSLHQMMCDAGVSSLEDEAMCMARRCDLESTGDSFCALGTSSEHDYS